MPLVEVYYQLQPELHDPLLVDDDVLLVLKEALPPIVAACLNCPDKDGQTQPDDIAVRLLPADPRDRSSLHLTIRIEAMWFPSRAANANERALEILRQLHWVIPGRFSRGVWLVLPTAGWAEAPVVPNDRAQLLL